MTAGETFANVAPVGLLLPFSVTYSLAYTGTPTKRPAALTTPVSHSELATDGRQSIDAWWLPERAHFFSSFFSRTSWT